MTTAVLIVATVLIVGGYTAWRAWQGRGDLTVSMTLRRWSRTQIAVPFALAALLGHWFGPPVPAWWPAWTPWVLAWLVGAVSMVGEAMRMWEQGEEEDERASMPLVWLGVMVGGYVAGAALWPLTGGA